MNTHRTALPDAIRDCAAVVADTVAHRARPARRPHPVRGVHRRRAPRPPGRTCTSSVRAAASKLQPDEPRSPRTSRRSAVAESAKRAAAAWGDAGAYEGTTEFGPGEMPARFAATITLQELALHGWDLARATGRPSPSVREPRRPCSSVVEQIAEQARSQRLLRPARRRARRRTPPSTERSLPAGEIPSGRADRPARRPEQRHDDRRVKGPLRHRQGLV